MPFPAGFDQRLLKQVVLIVFSSDLQIRTKHIRFLQTFEIGITIEVIILNILKKKFKYEYEIIVSDSGANAPIGFQITIDSGASVAHYSLSITRSPQCSVREHGASVVFPRAPARTLASASTTIEGRGCSLEPLIFP